MIEHPDAERMSNILTPKEMVEGGYVETFAQASAIKKRVKSGQWAKGVSGNPKGRTPGTPNKATTLRAAFVEAKAEDVLDVLLGHAFGDPATARWLATRMFGEGNWTPTVEAGTASTPEGCQQAMDQVLDAYVGGEIDAKELGIVTTALQARMDRLNTAKAPSLSDPI